MSEPNPRYILPTVEYIDALYELQRRTEEVTRLLHEGLYAEGTHHKQWYLWMIADTLKIDLSGIDIDDLDRGTAP